MIEIHLDKKHVMRLIAQAFQVQPWLQKQSKIAGQGATIEMNPEVKITWEGREDTKEDVL